MAVAVFDRGGRGYLDWHHNPVRPVQEPPERAWFLSQPGRQHTVRRMQIDETADVKYDAESQLIPDDNKVTMRDVGDVLKD